MSKRRCGSRARPKERREGDGSSGGRVETIKPAWGGGQGLQQRKERVEAGTARLGGCWGRRNQSWRKGTGREVVGGEGCGTSFLDVHKTVPPPPPSPPPPTPSPGQWPGHCQGLALSYRGCVPRRHSRERLRRERKAEEGLLLSFLCVLGPVPGSSQTVSHLIIITTL